MKKEFIIEELVYIPYLNAVQYIPLKTFFYFSEAIKYFERHVNKPLQFSSHSSVDTVYPVFILNKKGKLEINKIKE